MSDMHQQFLEEARELNDAIYACCHDIANTPDTGRDPIHQVHELFRSFHTLKGLAAMAGHDALAQFAHRVEDAMDALRRGTVSITPQLLNRLFRTTEFVDSYLDRIQQTGNAGDIIPDAHDFVAQLAADCIADDSPDDGTRLLPAPLRGILNDVEEDRFFANVTRGLPTFLVDVSFPLDSFDTSLRTAQEQVNQAGEWIATLPGTDPVNDQTITFRILLAMNDSPESVRAFFPADSRVQAIAGEFEPTRTKRLASVEPMPFGEISPDRTSSHQLVRVPMENLSALLQQVNELMVRRNRLVAAIRQTEPTGAGTQNRQLAFHVAQLGEDILALQKMIVDFRMVPLNTIFRTLETAVRRAAETMGKQVSFTMTGGNTRIDKQITDRLLEPFVHILRNAVDHGIEPEQLRESRGKDSIGKISVHAQQQGNAVLVRISDDGGGLDLDRIRSRAEEQGLIEPGTSLTERDIVSFLFQPGFTTAETVSQLSGRGVGLDVVRDQIAALGGALQVTSDIGIGTTFSVQIPVTSAILPVCFVRSGSFTAGIPLIYVLSANSGLPESPRKASRRKTRKAAQPVIPCLHLSALMSQEPADANDGCTLRLQYMDTQFHLVVDAVLGDREVSLTPFTGKAARIPLFAGIANLDDPEPAFILDIPQLAGKLEQTDG